MSGFILYLLVTLMVVVSVLLILIILIQKGRGGGLAGAFGGGGGGNTAFGSKTGDVLTWATSIIFGIFLLLAILNNITANKIDAKNAALIGTATRDTPTETPAGAPTSSNPLDATQSPPLTPAPTTQSF